MSSTAAATILGHLAADPELREHGDTTSAVLRIATNRRRSGPGGDEQELTTWWSARVFGRQAAAAVRILRRGALVCVTGEPALTAWRDRQGLERLDLVLYDARWTLAAAPSPGARPATTALDEAIDA